MAKKSDKSVKEAKQTQQEDSLLVEVQENIDHERMLRFFKRYSGFLGYAALGILLVFGGYETWSYFDTKNRQQAGDALVASLGENSSQIDLNKFNVNVGIKVLAEMTVANKLAEQQKFADAIAAYNAIYDNQNYDQALRELAAIKAQTIALNHDLDAKADIKGTVFAAHLQEIAALKQLKSGNEAEAKRAFAELKQNDKATPIIKNRADEFLTKIDAK